MNTRIITHAGSAHYDEFAACALITASYPDDKFRILRRDPTEEELSDPLTWVVDIGRELTPAKRNFDHHQYRGGKPAFQLVAEFLGCWDILLAAYPSMGLKATLDTQGPAAAAASIMVDTDQLMATISPLEMAVVDMFGEAEEVSPYVGWSVRRIGKTWLDTAMALRERMVELERTAKVEQIPGHAGFCLISTARGEDPSFGLAEFRKEWNYDNRGTGRVIVMSVSPERVRNAGEDAGTTLYRYDDATGVDFAYLAGKPGVKFSHKGGFLAILTRIVEGVTPADIGRYVKGE